MSWLDLLMANLLDYLHAVALSYGHLTVRMGWRSFVVQDTMLARYQDLA